MVYPIVEVDYILSEEYQCPACGERCYILDEQFNYNINGHELIDEIMVCLSCCHNSNLFEGFDFIELDS